MCKKIFLEKLVLKNFKGIKDLTVDFSKLTDIYGDNATGKTTLFDAFMWLLFDKDSQDKSRFDVQPLDENNNVVKMVETEVDAAIRVNDTEILLGKVLRQKWVKKRGQVDSEFKGYETTYSVDNVPKKQNEYKKFVSEIIQEDIFKLITNPVYFSTNIKWQDRKKILMDIIGEVTDEDVIDSKESLKPLAELLKNKSIEEIKKSINATIKKLIKEKESIPPRVDEKRRELKDDIDFSGLDFRKAGIVAGIKSLEEKLIDKSKINDELLAKKDELYALKSKLKDIEHGEMKKSESVKNKISEKLRDINSQIAEIKFSIKSLEIEKANNLKMAGKMEVEIKSLRSEWHRENKKVFKLPENARICPLCKRPFSDGDIAKHQKELQENFRKERAENLKKITARGQAKADEFKKYKKIISQEDADLKTASEKLNLLNKRKVELQNQINSFKSSVDMDGNKEYQEILKQIGSLQAELSKPVKEDTQIKELKEKKQSLEIELEKINRELGYKDMNEQVNKRINELLDKEKSIAQQIANLEKRDDLCNEFIKTKVKLLEKGINEKFKYVEFRFFKLQVNGGIEEDCEPLVNGVPFNTSLNNAARINAGIDIINTLCKHYKITAPVFIDNKESVTRIIDTDAQIINLIVSEADKTLRIEKGNNEKTLDRLDSCA
ncbi:AAA family ATPase [Clostridium sp. HV4-5-A1G]|uniref:AAA family ATPase n=1 Tax=Clostridium sp. HV4-5-A1G TaxID=2004595 RepID=UPI00123C13F8|nr:AAA family ATPase [Clostridium sp. HV4-5-A1G]KAA8668769.1 AAA family ATPase [Clostridium sp. HV4-5-A1G]